MHLRFTKQTATKLIHYSVTVGALRTNDMHLHVPMNEARIARLVHVSTLIGYGYATARRRERNKAEMQTNVNQTQ
jgi:hypothetical protein